MRSASWSRSKSTRSGIFPPGSRATNSADGAISSARRKLRRTRAPPGQGLVEPAGHHVRVEVRVEHQPLARAEVQVQVVVEHAAVPVHPGPRARNPHAR